MVFKKLAEQQGSQRGTIFLGAPEAEAEANYNSQMPLSAVYKDHCELIPSLAHEKFLIIGRKGTGKSAFAEYICAISQSEPNMFAKFIRQSDISFEGIIQAGLEGGHPINKESLYQWLILTNILKLFSENTAIKESRDYNLLRQFLNKNSGYIDIRESEVTEIIKKQGFDINIDYLKRFFSTKLSKALEIKQEKAPFYKLIPHLKEVLISVLTSEFERHNHNSYVLFFDDLDIGFDAQNPASIKSLVSLIRASKEINNELFAKNSIDAKVVLLLRDDITKKLSSLETDTFKVISSYAVHINWYQDDHINHNADASLNIKKFINDRIKHAFQEENLAYDSKDPWKSLVEDPFSNNQSVSNVKSTFRYVLDHTFFRPRDLLLFFKPLSLRPYKLPLTKYDINQLIGIYCEEIINELKNELSSFYSATEISCIFSAFGVISSLQSKFEEKSVKYDEAISIITDHCSTVSPSQLLEDMFQRSLVGSVSSFGTPNFKHREPATKKYELNPGDNVVIQTALRIYCHNKGYR
ncbi:P-loop ATPase, Sll1717 family [Aeromonas veronii]